MRTTPERRVYCDRITDETTLGMGLLHRHRPLPLNSNRWCLAAGVKSMMFYCKWSKSERKMRNE
ncbi:hypothetical protein WN943_011984 [Citrus x changshan-huyou]